MDAQMTARMGEEAVRIAIIGAGIAGLACSDRLGAQGIDTVLFDKGRGAGGRMSTRRIATSAGPVLLDHGAQYFTARDPLFVDQVSAWSRKGLAAPWLVVGSDAWVGTPTMNAPIRNMASPHDVRFSEHVQGLVRDDGAWWLHSDTGTHGPFDGAIIALPAEQAAPFLGLHDLGMASQAMTARSQPCWTAMIVFDSRLDIDVDHIRETGPISWACRNGAKPGREGPEAWVVQGSGTWSAAHLDVGSLHVAHALLDALVSHRGTAAVPALLNLTAHRWRFAMTRGTDQGALWNPTLRLGACGDWLLGPRVELAWLSGRKLADRVLEGCAGGMAT